MNFYVLKNDRQSRNSSIDIYGVDEKFGDATRCPQCGLYYSDLQWLPPYKIEIERRGRGFGDIVQGQGMNLFLSDNAKNAWHQAGLTGITSFHSVEVVSVKPNSELLSPSIYWHVSIERGPTAVDMSKSTFGYFIRKSPSCEYCADGYDAVGGFEVDESTWNRHDIFEPRNMPGVIVVTQSFVDMVKNYKLTNSIFIPARKYIFDPLHLLIPYTESNA